MFGKFESKRDTACRWVLLCFSVFGGFVFAYSYDTPASIKDLLFQYFSSQYSEAEFEIRYSLLYSLMALPDIFMSLFLGYLIDKFRIRVNFWVLSIMVGIGTTITFFGVQNQNFFIMVAGRFLLGASGESIHIVEGLFLRQYFNANEMSFIIAIVEAFLSLGGFLAFTVSPRIATYSMVMAFAVANYMCIINAILVLCVCAFDKWFEWKNPQSVTMTQLDTHFDEEQEKLTHTNQLEVEDDRPVIIPEQSPADDRTDHNEPEREGNQTEQSPQVHGVPPPRIRRSSSIQDYISNVMQFPAVYWYLLIAGATSLSSIQCFMMIGPSYILEKNIIHTDIKRASVKAATIVSLFRLTAAITLPFFGYLIDLTGKRPLWFLMGLILTTANHLFVVFIHPLPCCVLYGCCYAILASALWPSIYFIIPKQRLGIATALVSSIDNIGLMIYPAINGLIKAQTQTYDNAMYFLAATMSVAVFFAYKAYIILRKQPHIKGSLVLSRKSSIIIQELD